MFGERHVLKSRQTNRGVGGGERGLSGLIFDPTKLVFNAQFNTQIEYEQSDFQFPRNAVAAGLE